MTYTRRRMPHAASRMPYLIVKTLPLSTMKNLLFLLAQYPSDLSKRDRLEELISEVQNWKETTTLINAHGIIALAWYNIREARLETLIPEEIRQILENGYRQSVVRNLWLKERWKEVSDILGNAGIKHILLKGMALEHTIYEGKGLRQMTDNDILIRKDEAVRAWDLLRKNGFSILTPKSKLHMRIMKELSNHLPTLYKDGYALEIHVSLFPHNDPYHDITSDLPAIGREIEIDGKKACVLNDKVHRRYLVSHFLRHANAGECQFRTYADILLLPGDAAPGFQDEFLLQPDRKNISGYRQAAYRDRVKFISPEYRLPFLLGDIFPSVEWMKERYKCGSLKAMIYYPHRLGKLWWLVG